MKKIFRMQYEPCLGTCYEYDDILMDEINKLKKDKKQLDVFLKCLDYIHDKTCGDIEVGFLLDYDEKQFIGTFFYPQGCSPFIAKNLVTCYEKFVKLIDWYYTENTVKVNKEVCNHGRENNIIQFTLEKAGLKEYV